MEQKEQQNRPVININGQIINNGGTITGDIVNPTYNFGKKTDSSDDKIKEIIESLFKDGTVTSANQWYAIKRVLTDKNIAPKKLADFLTYVESLKLEGVMPYDNENVKKVGQRCTRLAVDVMAWGALKDCTDAEKSQILVAEKMLDLLM